MSVSIESCLENIASGNRFELVKRAVARAKALSSGLSETTISGAAGHKPAVQALMEIDQKLDQQSASIDENF